MKLIEWYYMSQFTIGGFFASAAGDFFPVYEEPCMNCDQQLESTWNIILMKDLTILNRTPDEIKKLTTSDIKKMVPGLSKLENYHYETPYSGECKERKNESYKITIPSELCECGRKETTDKIIEIPTWSCPCCLHLVCSGECFWTHVNLFHVKNIFMPIVVEPKMMGSEWCPMCHHILTPRDPSLLPILDNNNRVQFRSVSDEKVKTANPILCRVRNPSSTETPSDPGFKMEFTQFCIKNRICAKCETWDKNKIKLPKQILKGVHTLPPIYTHETIIPPYIQPAHIPLAMIFDSFDHLKKNITPYSQILPDLLRRSYFEEVNFPQHYSNQSNSAIHRYIANLWQTMLYVTPLFGMTRLRTPKELKKAKIPTEPILAAVRSEILFITKILTEIGISTALHPIIYSYLPWQLWNFDRIFSQIHSDIRRFGPSVAALKIKLISK
ncbi:MAG: hypothetical protein Hyperionvirus1_171 [Hyperionvirus sp.]|uniref:Uncharacterized protein n=1 Tax=Hyperionvirus sp. TaxID=2487770 RepID=A0A3G5A6D9_9VIRU|nr:MAG: hypothetical protein Hyperionvirus1_171 [Hyperionvirus sp.]